MNKIIAIIISVLLAGPALAQKNKSTAEQRLKGIDKELEKIGVTWHAAGYAVAVVEKDKIIYARGFGYRDYDNKLPVTPNTLFAIGSCSKSFTASLLGILRSEDKLSFNDRPGKYIPELAFSNRELNSEVTIKDLMCHRTGLPRHDLSWYLFPSNSKDSLLLRLAYQEPFADVREKWYYNNFMYLTQGVIAERITGKSWEENIREKFFAPMEMTTSNLSVKELENSAEASLGYELNDEKIEKLDYYRIAGMSPAGSINSSANEMANWLITWINGGKFHGKEIIPANYVTEATSSQMVVNSGYPSKEHPDLFLANYGYGWLISSYRGHYRVEHGGNINGFSANACILPTDSIGIVVLVNQDGSAVPSIVRNTLIDRILGLSYIDWNTELKERRDKAVKDEKEAQTASDSNRVTNTRPSHYFADYTGSYSNPGYGEFTITNRGDSLFAVFPLTKLWLKHYHYDIFEPFEVKDTGIDTTGFINGNFRFNFSTNNTGEISGLDVKLEPTIDPIIFDRQPIKAEVPKETLETYTGEYELAGTTAKVYLKNDSTLYLFVPGQPEYELYPTGLKKFSIKILDGYSVEFVEEAGKITAILFIQPNGTFKATRK